MTDEEMLAEEYVKEEGFRTGMFGELDDITSSEANKEIKQAFLAGLKAGRPKWHKVADGDLPKVSGKYWVYTGGEPFTLDYDTEVNAFGYWCAMLSGSLGVCDTVFETVEERKEDKVIAWKEIVLPKEKE